MYIQYLISHYFGILDLDTATYFRETATHFKANLCNV